MKKCELCENPAKMFCESDQASLCSNCDTKVHGANFLAAKHSRTLLCHVCQSLTPWNGSGPKLGLTISVCNACLSNGSSTRNNGAARNDNDDDDDVGDEDEDEDDDDEEEVEEEEEEENQVVPWSSTPPSRVSGSSTSDQESSSKFCNGEVAISSSRWLN